MTGADYDDDRPGAMRVHVASRRGDLACKRYGRNVLRAHAKARGVRTAFDNRWKDHLAFDMAQHGLIDAEGRLRDGFPGGTS